MATYIKFLYLQILPIAQGLLDKLISAQECEINTISGAPDPTAGAEANEETSWCLDEKQLHENVKKTLVKFCVPSPVVFRYMFSHYFFLK